MFRFVYGSILILLVATTGLTEEAMPPSNGDVQQAGIFSNAMVEVEAEVFQYREDGSREVLSNPRISTAPGNWAKIGVQATQNKVGEPGRIDDVYFQKELSGLGVQFTLLPEFDEDGLRLSGAVALSKCEDHREAFHKDGADISAYSITRTVIPFSLVVPENWEFVDLPAPMVNGKEACLRLRVKLSENQGSSPRVRQAARTRDSSSADGAVKDLFQQ